MSRSLYFIPLIEIALRQREPVKSIIEAFRKIESLGRKASHAEGFLMFISFMTEVSESWKMQRHLSGQAAGVVIDDLTFQIAAGILDSDEGGIDRADLPKGLLTLIKRRIRMFSVADSKDFRMELGVIRDGKIVTSVDLDTRIPSHNVSNILPGTYKFALGSGQVLWEVVLSKKVLLLSEAYSGQNLRFAADTGVRHKVHPTREKAVLGGEVVFRVFPGLERGRIEIETRNRR